MTIDDIRARQDELHTILNECQIIINGGATDFWGLLRRILTEKNASYKQDCYAAAENEDKSIRNFLGRMEALDYVINLVDQDFLEQAKRAKAELLSLDNQRKELEKIDQGVDSIIQDPMYREPGTL